MKKIITLIMLLILCVSLSLSSGHPGTIDDPIPQSKAWLDSLMEAYTVVSTYENDEPHVIRVNDTYYEIVW